MSIVRVIVLVGIQSSCKMMVLETICDIAADVICQGMMSTRVSLLLFLPEF